MWEWIWWIVGIGIGIALLRLFLRFTFVQEGTAAIIMRWRGVVKVFIQWTGYELDERGNVVPIGYKLDEKGNLVPTGEKIPEKPKKPWYGGLRVWIGLPVDKVYEYHLRFHTVEEKERKREPEYRNIPKANYVELRPDRYWRRNTRMETRDGQFPDVEWQIGMRCINPAKTIFKAPHNWVENALNELEPTLRAYVRTKNLTELLDLTREQIWTTIGKNRAIKEVLRKEWGIQIDTKEIGVFDVVPPPGYQEALAAKSRREMEAAARAEEILGTVVAAVVRATGAKENEIQAEFQKDPKAFYRKHKTTIDNTMTKLSMEERAYLRIETPGATGALGDFLRLIAAWQRMPRGRGEEREERRKSRVEKIIKEEGLGI